jgi:hypothetical protein
MKKMFSKIWATIALTAAMLVAGFGVRAQGQVDPPSASITLDTALAGRQAIASSLVRQTHHIVVRPTGASVVEKRDVCFSPQQLHEAGYITAGSVSELVHAIFVCSAKVDFDFVEVNGKFDIKLDVLVMSADGRLVLRGFGYAETVQATQEVLPEFRVKFDVNLVVPETITISSVYEVSAAKWVSAEYDYESELYVDSEGPGNYFIEIPRDFLESGTLILSTGGEKGGKDIIAHNLTDKSVRTGYEAYAYISALYHWDFRMYTDSFDFFGDETLIYEFGGEFYGQIPLVNETLTRAVNNNVIAPHLKVWGGPDKYILPNRIYVRKLSTFNEDGSVGKEFPEIELQFNPPAGGWMFNGEAGAKYHIRIEVDGLKPGGKG